MAEALSDFRENKQKLQIKIRNFGEPIKQF